MGPVTSDESVKERPPTPPHHPTYGVRLSEAEISAIIFGALQDEDVETIEQLPSGKSFNNRIYFITLKPKPGFYSELLGNSIVLKVPGHNFGVDKIQNEIACLLLLEKDCPAIPVPRVLAWYEGGSHIKRVHRPDGGISGLEERHDPDTRIVSQIVGDLSRHVSSNSDNNSARISREHRTMWILMTRLTGQTLQPDRVERRNLNAIMQQLALYVSQWRAIPSPSPQIGNLRFVSETGEGCDGIHTNLFGIKVAAHRLLIGSASSAMHISQEYYTTKVHGELDILKSNDNYAPNRASLVPLVEQLLHDILPSTALFNRSNGYNTSTFTHYDLSPRNILISPNSTGQLAISGIVDFEFAGFFPPEEEFTNTFVAGAGDWPSDVWSSLLSYLPSHGVDVPQGDFWNQVCALVRVIENIAPWQLREGGIRGEELDSALQQARLVIQENVEILRQGVLHYKQPHGIA